MAKKCSQPRERNIRCNIMWRLMFSCSKMLGFLVKSVIKQRHLSEYLSSSHQIHVLYVVLGNDEKKKQNGYHPNVLKYGMKVIAARTVLLFHQIYDSFIQVMEAEIARLLNLIKIFSCLLKF